MVVTVLCYHHVLYNMYMMQVYKVFLQQAAVNLVRKACSTT